MTNRKPLKEDQPSYEKTEPANPRIYKGTQVIDHDLFKLLPASMKKNVSFTEVPLFEHFEHCHIFHSFDSNGKPQNTTNQVGGHFHEVKITFRDNEIPLIETSPPKIWIRVKKLGKYVREMADVDYDTHVHEHIYLGSEKINLRKPNIEFAKFDAMYRAKYDVSVAGVLSTPSVEE